MSKRKKSYNKINENIYSNQQNNISDSYMDYGNYQNTFSNSVQDIFRNNINWNNIMNIMNSPEFRKINSIISLMSNGVDINNFDNLNFQNGDGDFEKMDVYNSELVLRFFNSLKPLLGNEFGDIIDRFIQFYMDDINKEKTIN